jgi:Carboxypeptidase regulatory-like domain
MADAPLHPRSAAKLSRRRRRLRGAAALTLVVALVGVILARPEAVRGQLQTGALYGVVTDPDGAALAGVTLTLTGGGAPQVQVSTAAGQFRFLGLAPGVYELAAELEGFSPIHYPTVAISVGRNTEIEVVLTPDDPAADAGPPTADGAQPQPNRTQHTAARDDNVT